MLSDKSQFGVMLAVVDKTIEEARAGVYTAGSLVQWHSGRVRRVCWSTLATVAHIESPRGPKCWSVDPKDSTGRAPEAQSAGGFARAATKKGAPEAQYAGGLAQKGATPLKIPWRS